MTPTKPKTVAAYVAGLPPAVRVVVTQVRRLVRRHLPAGYRETVDWGAITYQVPLRRYPTTYNGRPLCYVALAAQKGYVSLYLMGAYGSPVLRRRLETGFRKAGKRLNMGKSCIRFRSIDDLPLRVIGDVIAAVPMRRYIATAEATRTKRSTR